MSLSAKDHKSTRSAYKEQQKALCKKEKDCRKGENPRSKRAKLRMMSKGYGTASGRECCPGRNYGLAWEVRPRWLAVKDDEETETGAETETECDLVEQETGASDDEVQDEESYELQLAKALSLSLAEAAESENDAFDVEDVDEADGYSLMETDLEDDESDNSDTDCSDDEPEWIDVQEFGWNVERPTYAQMTKMEVT